MTTVTRARLVRRLWAGIGLAAVLATTGCVGDADAGREPDASGEQVVASVPVGELGGLRGELQAGQEIHVLIDTPEVDWIVTSSAPEVVEVTNADSEANPRVVKIVAASAGESIVEFVGSIEDAHDAIEISVDAESTTE